MEQIFLKEKCKFYARESKGSKPQMLYCNIKVNGERIVVGTGVKVVPDQFSAKKQRALVSNDLSELENRNNRAVNETIAQYISKFTGYVQYLMENPDRLSEAKEILPNFVPMKRKKANEVGRKFTETLEYIFGKELEAEVRDKSISEERREVKTTHLKAFYEFLDLRKIPQAWASLTVQNYRDYSSYLVNERKTRRGEAMNVSTINNHLSTLKAVVNAVCERDLDRTPIDTKRWKLVEKQITASERKSVNYVFSDAQLDRIIGLELEGNAAIVRDIFVFGCFTGQRPADNVRLLNGEGRRFVSEGIPVISLLPHKTRKTDKVAFVPIFNAELVDQIIGKFRDIPEYREYLRKTDRQRNALNSKWIKRIFSEAGLTDTFEATRQRGNEVSKGEASQTDTAHIYLARHYFITYMCRHGVSEADVIEMTGHTSTKQIHETYAHLTIEEQAGKLTRLASIQALAGNPDEEVDKLTAGQVNRLIRALGGVADGTPDPVEKYAREHGLGMKEALREYIREIEGIQKSMDDLI